MSPPRDDPRVVHVALGERSYDAVVGSNLLSGLGQRARRAAPPAARAMLAVDRGVPQKHRAAAAESLRHAGFEVATCELTAAEHDKSLAQVERMLVEMESARHERRDPVVALGGGIIGDLAGFAAAVYRRGVPVIQCPSTLLAMVDASVGGKTGANLALADGSLAKNAVGAFHQPVLVLADTDLLASLPDGVFRAGLAECVKHALLSGPHGDADLLAFTERSADAIHARDPGTLIELIARNVAVKAAVVAGDERESGGDGGGDGGGGGGRMVLNLGHTFAHALEAFPSLGLSHGQAVSLGLVAACAAGERLGLTPSGLGERTRALLNRFGLPTEAADLPGVSRLRDAMSHDKKVAGGRLRLVVPAGDGACRIADGPDESAIAAGWSAIGAAAD